MKNLNVVIAYLAIGVFLFTSCNSDDTNSADVVNNESFLVIEASKVLRNQVVSFELVDAADGNHTSKATFYVDGDLIDGHTFSSSSEGVYQVYAEYNLAGTITTTSVGNVEVFIPQRKVLVEDYTGTWCGFCPRMTTFVQEAQALTNDITVVSIHGNSINTGVDPFTIDEGMFLKNYFQVPGYPTGIIDRGAFWNESNINPQILDASGIDNELSIGINSFIQNDILNVDVKVISEAEMSSLKLVVFLLEDNLLADQASYYNTDPTSPYYQMGDPLVDFRHDHVLRISLTEPLGNSIDTTAALEVYRKSLSVQLPQEFERDNLSLVAIVTDGSTDMAINSQKAELNENKNFE